jgi:hypothetical protein
MPAAVALRTARASGSARNESVEAAPRLRFMTRMLASRERRITQSMPASTSAMLPTPRSSSTRTSYRSAAGAMPRHAVEALLPAATEATCVPWP